jgi:hypothetical protein
VIVVECEPELPMLAKKWSYHKLVDLFDGSLIAILREGFSWAEVYDGNGRWRRLSGIIYIDYPFAESISEAEAEDLVRQLDAKRSV